MTCYNPDHDHTEVMNAEGDLVRMACPVCYKPSHYDYGVDTYVHDDGSAGCFGDPGGSPCWLVRYPEVVVPLLGHDSNTYAVLCKVQRALRLAGVNAATVREFMHEAISGDDEHLLMTVIDWVAVE